MHKLLELLNKEVSTHALKGGTSLLLCYGLDRFSEDIDLDATGKKDLRKYISAAFSFFNIPCEILTKKDTDTVLRYSVHYKSISEQEYPLKIEISFREAKYLKAGLHKITEINKVRVYTIEHLFLNKKAAFSDRNKARDIYDLHWLISNYPGLLNEGLAKELLSTLTYKGIDKLEEDLLEEAKGDHILSDSDMSDILMKFVLALETKLDIF